jgi:hypothetical protein
MAVPAMKPLLALPIYFVLAQAAQPPAAPLFDGKTLNGWEVCNGRATYRVEDGTIVGTTVEGSPNSFLCTKKSYGDFVLEFDTKIDPALNSGVQIRSHRRADTGRVFGYQVEMVNEKAGASGGIYDEERRGWLDNVASDPVASKAFKDNQWNHFKVEAMGDHMRVWINGIPCANLNDPVDQTGFIGLQVHEYQGEKPAQVRWRNITIQDLGRHVWKPLWDGKTFNGWTPRGGGKFTIEEGAIHGQSLPDDPRVAMLVSEQSFKDLTVRVSFKIIKGNSGFFVRTDKENLAAYEVEIDEAKRTGGFWETGPDGRKWVTGPEDNGAVKAGAWNELTASLHGHRIVFHVNGVRTLYLPDDAGGRLEGHLGLQAHGSKNPTEIWFKDIEILVPER